MLQALLRGEEEETPSAGKYEVGATEGTNGDANRGEDSMNDDPLGRLRMDVVEIAGNQMADTQRPRSIICPILGLTLQDPP